MTEMYISFPIVHISFIITPLYNFIDDSYFAKMPALRQIWNPEHFYSCSRQICHRRKAKASLSAFRFLCGCASCNCIKTRMFSAHSNLFLYSICMNKEKVGYIEITHCQSGSMVLFPAIRRKFLLFRQENAGTGIWLNELTPMRVLKVPVKIMFLP